MEITICERTPRREDERDTKKNLPMTTLPRGGLPVPRVASDWGPWGSVWMLLHAIGQLPGCFGPHVAQDPLRAPSMAAKRGVRCLTVLINLPPCALPCEPAVPRKAHECAAPPIPSTAVSPPGHRTSWSADPFTFTPTHPGSTMEHEVLGQNFKGHGLCASPVFCSTACSAPD